LEDGVEMLKSIRKIEKPFLINKDFETIKKIIEEITLIKVIEYITMEKHVLLNKENYS